VSGITVGEHALNTLGSRLVRQSTVASYLQTLRHLHLEDLQRSDVTLTLLWNRLLAIANMNTRRKHVVALRSIFRDEPWIRELRIPRSTPRVYDLPDEDSLRFAMMLSPYELQGLLMMYGGLRISEACAVTPKALRGNVLTVQRQMDESGQILSAKTVGDVVLPRWLVERAQGMHAFTSTPGAVRESLRRNGKKVGILCTPHMLRHWYATMLVSRRINPEIARQQLRHADLKTTLGYYAQVAKADIDAVVTDLFD
jgi:integrase